ncbi:hypothetical protein ACFY9R_26525 [Streptomyces albidoflavus]|uniref:hypothetical protein n=1 Tax=Streptomyces albidoflavus TaxID=1886 RepID=UPI0033F2803D
MIRIIRPDYAPALGDLRVMGLGDIIVVQPGATDRRDWPRYQDAIGQAVARGAEVQRQTNGGA